MRASQKNNYDSHGNEVRWPPGCLFFPRRTRMFTNLFCQRIERMARIFLSRNANCVSRRGRRMRRGTHRFSCVWPSGCLFFAHEGHGWSRIFCQRMIRIKLMRHALCLCSSGVVALLPTDGTGVLSLWSTD